MENINNNHLFDEHEQHEFQYNFIDTPWDDRSRYSRFGIVLLLMSIFVVTLGLVFNNVYIHYQSFYESPVLLKKYGQDHCQIVQAKDYRYVARIYLETSQKLTCAGAVISHTSVLTHTACVQKDFARKALIFTGLIRVYVGDPSDFRCNMGFGTKGIKNVISNDRMSSDFIILTTHNSMSHCIQTVQISTRLDKTILAYIIGTLTSDDSFLSRHPSVIVEDSECFCSTQARKFFNRSNGIFCVRSALKCPMLVGDLLIQNDQLFGVSISNTYNNIACFSNLEHVEKGLKELQF